MIDGPGDSRKVTPSFCQYSAGPCDQDFSAVQSSDLLFLYPSDPPAIAATIEAAIGHLKGKLPDSRLLSWRDLNVTGQLIFCEVCKAIRFAETVVADVTTLNFNLLFEIGFAIGLGVPVVPIRDTSLIRDEEGFRALGLLDTLGYLDFQNANQLAGAIAARLPVASLPETSHELNRESPLYVLKGPVETEAEVRLFSSLKKSALRFRTHDVRETPRLSMHEARRQVGASLAVVAHLLSDNRRGARVHNARCAFVAGLAMSSGKATLMLQEGAATQPIDYRDVVSDYGVPDQVARKLEPTIRHIVDWLQTSTLKQFKPPSGLLQKIDIGDVAAENEIRPLKSYFVETGQFLQAKRGHARLVVGRKGSGKTAIFYSLLEAFSGSKSRIVLDLKPEGHQFTRLREAVLEKLGEGLKEHTLAAFWNVILLSELAHKILSEEETWAKRDPARFARFMEVRDLYSPWAAAERGDFSERLLTEVERLSAGATGEGAGLSAANVTEVLYSGDIRELSRALAAYLAEKDQVILLIDNLDKSWPTRGATEADILVVRTLLEASRKLQRILEDRGVELYCLVFLRNDIYEHLVRETPDKGKDTAITLDWSDREVFKEIFRRRVLASGLLKEGDFESLWTALIDRMVDGQHSLEYILDRTLLRPRDFLNFLHRAIEVAVNRGHERISAEDLVQAEHYYSEDILQATDFELRDVLPGVREFLWGFLGCRSRLKETEVLHLLRGAGVPDEHVSQALELLVWFGFLGVAESVGAEPRFSFEMRYDLPKLMAPMKRNAGHFVVHPAFRRALECEDLA